LKHISTMVVQVRLMMTCISTVLACYECGCIAAQDVQEKAEQMDKEQTAEAVLSFVMCLCRLVPCFGGWDAAVLYVFNHTNAVCGLNCSFCR
jgi:hypothetical protein